LEDSSHGSIEACLAFVCQHNDRSSVQPAAAVCLRAVELLQKGDGLLVPVQDHHVPFQGQFHLPHADGMQLQHSRVYK
jgi:hypothetical protein